MMPIEDLRAFVAASPAAVPPTPEHVDGYVDDVIVFTTPKGNPFGTGRAPDVVPEQVGFWVTGNPKPKGSMKCIGRRGKVAHVLTEDDSSGDRKRWREAVATVADQARRRRTIDYPVEVHVSFYLERPANQYGTGRNRDIVKDTAPQFPTGKTLGDLDKMQRNLGDALVDGHLLADDSLIVDWIVSKRWAVKGRAGAAIRVYRA